MCIRTEAFYAAWADADHDSYPNLKLTHRAGLDVIVFDHRTPDAVLEFLRLGVYVCVCAFGKLKLLIHMVSVSSH